MPDAPDALATMSTVGDALPCVEGGEEAAIPPPADVPASTPADPPAVAPIVEHIIIIDFEGTCDPSDESLTRLQQCEIHEIIEFPAVWVSATGDNIGAEIDYFREYVKPVEGAAEGQAREISAFCEHGIAHPLPARH